MGCDKKKDMNVTFSVILSKQFNPFLFIYNASFVSDEWRMDNTFNFNGYLRIQAFPDDPPCDGT